MSVCLFLCMLGVICEFMMREQGMCITFCFILTKTALETYIMLRKTLTNSRLSARSWKGSQCLKHWCTGLLKMIVSVLTICHTQYT
jgi:hypothetical protein